MKTRKQYTMAAHSARALLKAAAKAHTKSIAARRKKLASPIGSFQREDARIDEIREGYYTLGIMFALKMLDGTAAQKRRARAFGFYPMKRTPTRKAHA